MLGTSPIPDDLRKAFADAIHKFADWDRGGPQPLISFKRRPHSLTEIFDQVALFPDTAPDYLHAKVRLLAEEFRGGPEALGHACEGPKDTSYVSITQCLRSLLKARQAHYARRATDASP